MIDIKPKNVNFSSQLNSRDYYKGTSFRFAGMWEVGKLYSNDTFFIDFVSHDGKMYVCIKSHYSNNNILPTNNEYWDLVVEGHQGIQGDTGLTGAGAIHVGPESPCEYKNAHLDDADIQSKYEYCENMLWIDPTESDKDFSSDILYSGYVSCGGTLSKEDFCDQFNKLLSGDNEVEEGQLKNYYTKDEVDELIDSIDSVNLDNYYTKDEIDTTISAVQVDGGKIDGSI